MGLGGTDQIKLRVAGPGDGNSKACVVRLFLERGGGVADKGCVRGVGMVGAVFICACPAQERTKDTSPYSPPSLGPPDEPQIQRWPSGSLVTPCTPTLVGSGEYHVSAHEWQDGGGKQLWEVGHEVVPLRLAIKVRRVERVQGCGCDAG